MWKTDGNSHQPFCERLPEFGSAYRQIKQWDSVHDNEIISNIPDKPAWWIDDYDATLEDDLEWWKKI